MRTPLSRTFPANLLASAFLSLPNLLAQTPAAPNAIGSPAAVQAPIEASFSASGNETSPTTGLKISGVSPPSPIHIVEPEYSREARAARLNGTVLVALIVDANGLPQNVHVEHGVGMGLDEKAIEAVKKYTFHPAKLNGRPVPVAMKIEVSFQTSSGPHLIHSFPANLTDEARQRNFHGTVEVALTVDENGIPRNVHVLQPVGMGLDEKAVKAAQLYSFDPVISNGIPVSVQTVIAVRFKDK